MSPKFLDFVFPKKCLECGASGRYICKDCLAKVMRYKAVCVVCRRPSIDGVTHAKCNKPLGLNGAFSLWKYSGVIKKSIIALKYKFAYQIARELTDPALKIILPNADIFGVKPTLIPVPLYWYKENYRGFNQSGLVGEKIAQSAGWVFDAGLVARNRNTSPQAGLGRKERFSNVAHSFCLPDAKGLFANTNYIIFDDVFTTGSTAKEVCKLLKRNGAKNVWSLTLVG